MDNKEKLEQMLKSICRGDYEKEYRFWPKRRFRFDYSWPGMLIAIEYEGIFGGKSRHMTVKGYTNDCIKYNKAAQDGWRVYRFTASFFTKKEIGFTLDFLKQIFTSA